MSVRDGRLAPFCYQSLAAVRTIHAKWAGQQRSTALAIYQALTYQANEERSREGFEASRRELADLAGVSDRTLDKYAEEMVQVGLLVIERNRAGDLNLPNRWTLIEPGEGGEVISPLAKPVRQGGEVISHGVAKSFRTDKKNEEELEEPPNPPEGGRERDLRKFEADCKAYALAHFPDVENGAYGVSQAVRYGATTLDQVASHLEHWFAGGSES